MKFKTHLTTESVIFVILYFILGLQNALIVSLFHFIPSIEFFMKRLNILKGFSRQLLHNIFVVIISSVVLFYFTNPVVGTLGTLNFLLHLIMDLGGGGAMIFYPFSSRRLRYQQKRFELLP